MSSLWHLCNAFGYIGNSYHACWNDFIRYFLEDEIHMKTQVPRVRRVSIFSAILIKLEYCKKISGALIYWWFWQILTTLIWILILCGSLHTYRFASMTSTEYITQQNQEKREKKLSLVIVRWAEAELSSVISLTSVGIQVISGNDLCSLHCGTVLKPDTVASGSWRLFFRVTMKNRICTQDQCNIGSHSLIYANIFYIMQTHKWPFFG